MKSISVAATNPCHLFHMARALHQIGQLHTYYSGYPQWKLPETTGMNVSSYPMRTLSVYGILRYVPPRFRPKDHVLFEWQDAHFDRLVAKDLGSAEAIHGMPGQCLETFRAAKRIGMQTILNHATGPSTAMAETLREEYARVGMRFDEATRFDATYAKREAEETNLADYHCVASSIVADQLAKNGVAPEKIWQVPYGADEQVFFPSERKPSKESTFNIVFAGQLTLRKGVRFLLEALTLAGSDDWQCHLYGGASQETAKDLEDYAGRTPLEEHGSVSQAKLAQAFRDADLLVLPSLEEGFGLVVVQALNCGLPCIVSDATGAKDLIQHRKNGSIIPTSDAESLAHELHWWSEHRRRVSERHDWETAAHRLASYHSTTPPLTRCA